MSKSPRVFVVQNTLHKDEAGALVPRHDLTSASIHGELIELLGPSAKPFNSEPIVAELRRKLRDYSDADSILLVGNPCLIGFVVAIAAYHNHDRVRCLQWSGTRREYVVVEAYLGDPALQEYPKTWSPG